MRNNIEEYKKVVEKMKFYEKQRRLLESELLGPEYDYLEIDDDGYLSAPYGILDSTYYTFDKVVAAGTELGKKRMDEDNGKNGNLPFYKARNEINERVGRKPVYSDKDFVNEMDKINNFMKVKRRDYYDKY